MQVHIQQEQRKSVLQLHGRLEFEQRRAVIAGIEHVLHTDTSELEIDLSGVSHIDSAGLALLMLMRDKLLKHNKQMSLVRYNPGIKNLIDSEHFRRLFIIH